LVMELTILRGGWPRHVEPDDVGGLGGKWGIIALTPGFPPGKVDLVRPRLRRQQILCRAD